MGMEAIYYGRTDVGQVRKNNEDTFIAQTIWNETHVLCAAIDGIGGNYGGGVAAEVTHDTIISHLEDFPVWNLSECLQQAVIDANNVVISYQHAIAKYRSMGCVMSLGILNVKDRVLHFVHVGDTRIYSLHDGQLNLLTRDDAQGQLVTNYIGKKTIMPDTPFCEVQEIQLQEDTTLLFCTDGLWKMLEEKEITDILSLQLSSEDICKRLIDRANEKGGLDNITAVVVKLKKNSKVMGTSKKLSYLLRHSEIPDNQGWIPVEVLVRDYDYTEQSLKQIVANDEKHRYEFSEDDKKVRALYGHSNHVRIHWDVATPPKTLYHGTAKKNLNAILQEGLKSMGRQYVHLSETIEDAIKVGKRHGKPVVLAIDTQKVIDDGGCFYRVPNGIWLSEKIKSQYIYIIRNRD